MNDLDRMVRDAFNEGGQYVLQYLAEVFEGVEDTDVWAEFFPDENKD